MTLATAEAERSDDAATGITDVAITRAERDQVLAFRPVILAIRGGSTAVSVGLAAPAFASQDWIVIISCALVVAYNVFRIVQPIRYLNDTASIVRVLVEVTLHVSIVVATGFWESPFVFSLISAITIAGFARGFAFAVRVSIVASLAISIPFLAYHDVTSTDLRITTQWSVWLTLVALIAGYARRILGEADRQHSLALDRLGRLADANLLLYSLHRIAQTLPASLDLEESLDTTMGRLKDLFQCDGIALLLLDDTDHRWVTARSEGPRPSDTYTTEELPPPLRQALERRRPVVVDQLLINGPGLSGEMESGLYAVLPARDSTVGLLALEHREQHRFRLRDQELLDGFVEPAA
ncbi:MAG: GAF domain-containing protein, partial [Aquihabitans sp.]